MNVLEYFDIKIKLEEINLLKKKRYKSKNRYINSLLDSYIKVLEKRFETNIDDGYFHKYELYEMLYQIDSMLEYEDSDWGHVEYVIERLENNIEIIETYDKLYKHSINLEEVYSIIEDLKEIKELIEDENFNEAIIINNKIIKRYFEDKEDKYRNKVNEKYHKRKDKEEQYFKLIDRYKAKEITKKEIAKELGVTPAAVTQFFKRHGIT